MTDTEISAPKVSITPFFEWQKNCNGAILGSLWEPFLTLQMRHSWRSRWYPSGALLNPLLGVIINHRRMVIGAPTRGLLEGYILKRN
jgi:hypothetical protein